MAWYALVWNREYCNIFKTYVGTSPVVQWLRLCTSNAGARIRSLVRALRSHMPCGSRNFFLNVCRFMAWRRQWQPTSVCLPGESQGRRGRVGCRLWGRTESDTTDVTQQQQQQQQCIIDNREVRGKSEWGRDLCRQYQSPLLCCAALWPVVSDSLWPHALNLSDKNIGVGCRFFPQELPLLLCNIGRNHFISLKLNFLIMLKGFLTMRMTDL